MLFHRGLPICAEGKKREAQAGLALRRLVDLKEVLCGAKERLKRERRAAFEWLLRTSWPRQCRGSLDQLLSPIALGPCEAAQCWCITWEVKTSSLRMISQDSSDQLYYSVISYNIIQRKSRWNTSGLRKQLGKLPVRVAEL